MNNKAIVSMFLLLFFVLLGASCAVFCGHFFDVGGHGNIAAALAWTAGISLVAAAVFVISLLAAMWE